MANMNTTPVKRDDTFDQSVTPQFLQELLPAGEKTELLFHISYLCLGKFPQLERVIRANAVEAQMIFSSSEALLMQCVVTSDNLVKTLFPMLTKSVEKQNAVVAIKFLEKARKWIDDLIKRVDDTVKEYSKLNLGVASATSDVIKVKKETTATAEKLTKEQEALKQVVDSLGRKLKTAQDELAQNISEMDKAEKKLKEVVDDIACRDKKFGIAAAVVPIFGLIVDAVQRSINSSADRAKIEEVKIKISRLQIERAILANSVGRAETELLQEQFKLTTISINLGRVPDPVHLPEVQACLTKIQNILLQLKSFWEKIGVMVTDLQQKTFAAEDLLSELCDPDFKKTFLDSIELAGQSWCQFSAGCNFVVGIFTVRSKDAYKFLETDPSNMSEEEWKKEYDALKKRLDQFYAAPAVNWDQKAAITQ